MEKLKIIVHTGDVQSKSDGDIHRIGVRQLLDLYGVLPSDEVVIFDPKNPLHTRGSFGEGAIHIGPRFNGDYPDLHAESTPSTV